jgi:L-seryl-tRNA(Ser) seleniumtransferase
MSLRDVPAVHRLLAEPQIAAFARDLGHGAVKAAVDAVLDDVRRAAASGAMVPDAVALAGDVAVRLRRIERAGLLAVINATGVLLHTNLGRAPLAPAALAAMAGVGEGYSNLEFDLDEGRRASRYERVADLLRAVSGAEDALVVNNCAAAVLLVLDTFARGREVVVARGELIEIGGGFRLPDVLARSGATLVEAGATNKCYVADIERALTPSTALLLRSHLSNFRMTGFTRSIAPHELAALGKRVGVPVVEDLGSGALIDLERYGLPHERTVQEAVRDGLDLIAFSGDKLLGGPQAGIIVGRRASIARLRANPLLRALRVDKATLAALGATLRLYLAPGAPDGIPLYAMMGATIDALRARGERLAERLGARVVASESVAGGGTLPGAVLPSIALSFDLRDADDRARRLRCGTPAVVGRVAEGSLLLDLRTVPSERDADLERAVRAALA